MKNFLAILVCMMVLQPQLDSQIAKTYHLYQNGTTLSLLPSNSASDIYVAHDTVWFGTDKGLSQTIDGGMSFRNFANTPPFDSKGTSAIALNDKVIWVAIASSFTQDNQSVPQGEGLDFSTDRGETWTHVAQPVDTGLVYPTIYGIDTIKTLAVTTTANNITYDLAVTSSTVWAANFAGMLRKSTDNGTTWHVVVLPPDSLDSISPNDSLNFDLSPVSGNQNLRQNLNHRVFSVFASDDTTIWVGTAGGINKSTDGGVRWQKFSHQNEAEPISGNFVVAINEQHVGNTKTLWAATVNAEASDEQRGVSFSTDGGATWKTTLLGEFAHNIGFMDSIVYVATDDGLFRSSDAGNSWIKNGTISDPTNLQRISSPAVYAVATEGDTIWVAGPDGMASTLDSPFAPFGINWRVFRTYVPVGSSAGTYSYPLPFSPNQEAVRIHYGLQGHDAPVTIKIFDYAMHPVKTLIQNAVRSASFDQDEIWNGLDDRNRRVANGVYFYSVEVGNLGAVWGKIMVIQ